jgi:hypothetical protein
VRVCVLGEGGVTRRGMFAHNKSGIAYQDKRFPGLSMPWR